MDIRRITYLWGIFALASAVPFLGQSPLPGDELSPAELAAAQKAFQTRYKALYDVEEYPHQVALTSIGLTRTQLVRRFKIECPRWNAEPDVAEPTYWRYYWQFMVPVLATFTFDKDGRVETVKIEKSGSDYGKHIGSYQVMADHMNGYVPHFAYKAMPSKDRSKPFDMNLKLVQGYVDADTLKQLADAGKLRDRSAGRFWLVFKNPQNKSFVTVTGATDAYDLCSSKRTLDIASGRYKYSYAFSINDHWDANPIIDIYVGKSPRITARTPAAVALPPIHESWGLSIP